MIIYTDQNMNRFQNKGYINNTQTLLLINYISSLKMNSDLYSHYAYTDCALV